MHHILNKQKWFLVLVGFLCCSVTVIYSQTTRATTITTSYEEISVQEAKSRIDSNPNIFILDVRSEKEYAEGHIPEAIQIKYTQIFNNIERLPENFSREILVYCDNGFRSRAGASKLSELGYSQVVNMLGGLNDWIAEGYPIVTGYPTNTSISNSSKLSLTVVLLLSIAELSLVSFIIGTTKRNKSPSER